MINIFNKLSILPSAVKTLRSVFDATKAGVSIHDVMIVLETFDEKLGGFKEAVNKESSKARTIFAENIFLIAPDGAINLPKTWKEFFQVLQTGLEKTEIEVSKLESAEEAASLGRIKYRVDLLSAWYNAQDTRLMPVLESFGKLRGVHMELASFFPQGKHEISIRGKKISIEIS